MLSIFYKHNDNSASFSFIKKVISNSTHQNHLQSCEQWVMRLDLSEDEKEQLMLLIQIKSKNLESKSA